MIPKGFQVAGFQCGLKNKRKDVGMIVAAQPIPTAVVVTQNKFRAAPIEVTVEQLGGKNSGLAQAVVVNSGNANCATGEQGFRDARRMVDLAALHGQVTGPILVCSTGVIGQKLDMQKVERGIIGASQALGSDAKAFMEAILTTDLVEKWAVAWLEGDEVRLASPREAGQAPKDVPTVVGFAKGSGMIAPNMATMLAYLLTDFKAPEDDLYPVLKTAADQSFNRLTVDGDTSTNDMVSLMASGESGVKPTADQFQRLVNAVALDLAKQVARDGEGATKLVEVRVSGSSDPKLVAKTIAESPLVKTAMFGNDPNWGRIVAAAGRSGADVDVSSARLTLQGKSGVEHLIFANGEPSSFDAAKVSAELECEHVVIRLSFGDSTDEAIYYSCDFGYGYVRINAEYHT
jgi:glutamate N-acetyltransferase/amino-acid N-acetyltransferase